MQKVNHPLWRNNCSQNYHYNYIFLRSSAVLFFSPNFISAVKQKKRDKLLSCPKKFPNTFSPFIMCILISLVEKWLGYLTSTDTLVNLKMLNTDWKIIKLFIYLFIHSFFFLGVPIVAHSTNLKCCWNILWFVLCMFVLQAC